MPVSQCCLLSVERQREAKRGEELTLLASAESLEVLHRLGHGLAIQLNGNTTESLAVGLNVKEHLVRHQRLCQEEGGGRGGINTVAHIRLIWMTG